MGITAVLHKISYREAIWLVLLIVLIIPVVRPIGIPFVTSEPVRILYDKIQSLPAGSVVLFDCAFGSSFWPELGYGVSAVMKHLLSRPLKILVVSTWLDGPPMYVRAMSLVSIPSDKKYGTDFVFLGYVPGAEVGIAGLLNDLQFMGKDYYGTPLKDLPMMSNIRNGNDIAMAILFYSTAEYVDFYVRQWTSKYNKPTYLGVTASAAAQAYTYYPNQVAGIINSVRGSGEYETLNKSPGRATAQLDALSAGHVLTILLIALGNVVYLMERKKKKAP